MIQLCGCSKRGIDRKEWSSSEHLLGNKRQTSDIQSVKNGRSEVGNQSAPLWPLKPF